MAPVLLPSMRASLATIFCVALWLACNLTGIRGFLLEFAGGRGLAMTLEATQPQPGLPPVRPRRWIQCLRLPDAPEEGAFRKATADSKGESTGTNESNTIVRILSYNVLGPRHALTKKHDYCPLKLRRWTKRSKRLEQEIREYHQSAEGGLHAVCLQEVTPKTLRDTWIPFTNSLGLDSYLYQPKDPFPKQYRQLYSHLCLGVAIFYSTKVFIKTAEKRVFFPQEVRHLQNERLNNTGPPKGDSMAPKSNRSNAHTGQNQVDYCAFSRLEDDLSTTRDAAVMLRLKLRERSSSVDNTTTDVKRGSDQSTSDEKIDPGVLGEADRSITLVCCHLWYDPVRPDLKTAQCKLLFGAIERFHEECGVITPRRVLEDWECEETEVCGQGGHEEEATSNDESQGEGSMERNSAEATNLVLCGDFNSLPFVQPHFLPGELQVVANKALAMESTRRPAEADALRYPSSEASASGVYSLLAYGHVHPEHPEHPDAFIPQFTAEREARAAYAKANGIPVTLTWQQKRFSLKSPRRDPSGVHRAYGEWSSGYGHMLEDVYRDRCDASPRFTTKTNAFMGVIDHIFVSSGEPTGRLSVRGVLGFPKGADVASSVNASAPRCGDDASGFGASGARGTRTHIDGTRMRIDSDARRKHDAGRTSNTQRVTVDGGNVCSSSISLDGNNAGVTRVGQRCVGSDTESLPSRDGDSAALGIDREDSSLGEGHSRRISSDSDCDRTSADSEAAISSSTCREDAKDGEFGPIPDETWGSDHLALGVELEIRQPAVSGDVALMPVRCSTVCERQG